MFTSVMQGLVWGEPELTILAGDLSCSLASLSSGASLTLICRSMATQDDVCVPVMLAHDVSFLSNTVSVRFISLSSLCLAVTTGSFSLSPSLKLFLSLLFD